MIFLIVGGIFLTIGLIFYVHPAQHPSFVYGYYSYLATVNTRIFRRAQRLARQTLVIFGIVLLGVGTVINRFDGNRYFIIWIFLAVLVIVSYYALIETWLKQDLQRHHELPTDYVTPDEALKQQPKKKTKGLRDRLK